MGVGLNVHQAPVSAVVSFAGVRGGSGAAVVARRCSSGTQMVCSEWTTIALKIGRSASTPPLASLDRSFERDI